MDRIDQLRGFIQVAEMGSFTRAAAALDWPRTTLSLAVQRLEDTVGARLLHRTTRRVQLTPDGQLLLRFAQALVEDAERLEQLFRERREEVAGRLILDLPSRVAQRLVAPALDELLRRHPRLQVLLGATDRYIDPVAEGVDCLVRFGSLNDSSLVARRLGRVAMVNCASPGYLAEHGRPLGPAALDDGHVMVGYVDPESRRAQGFEIVEAGQSRVLDLPSRIVVNNAETYIACCVAGHGLIQVPRFDVDDLLCDGALREVLPDCRPAGLEVSVLYPHRRHRSSRIDAFVDWFTELMTPHLECGESVSPGTKG
ncbi:LysR family transcriptional regulator [Halomonas maura]|uniref:LysR family transcriptional regulator n=1 Tax=Halomonas maura TaxID=117606 RepID=UPI0025B2ED99|nr:LysR family transcriptional regulator [Halomonas maura]MDN3554384.1 LysR family transcriptional regulator [Halomonas maura]